MCWENAGIKSLSLHLLLTCPLQVLKPLIVGFLINVKDGALVLLTPSGTVPGLPSRFAKRYQDIKLPLSMQPTLASRAQQARQSFCAADSDRGAINDAHPLC